MPTRENARLKWLEQVLDSSSFSLTPLAGDASFRQYYRLQFKDATRMLMDAPPPHESLTEFIDIAGRLRASGLLAPKCYAYDLKQGFAIIDDFGDTLLLSALSPTTADGLYLKAIDTLIQMQSCEATLPAFDVAFMLKELSLLEEWFIEGYLKWQLTAQEKMQLAECLQWLAQVVGNQPRVFIHRDYHSRNIMLLKDSDHLGLIDFQDAMCGSFVYDLVSLLKDCYIQWSNEDVLRWLTYYYDKARICSIYSLEEFIQAVDLCGLQRHLKVLGVFSRLYLRDNKAGYLQNLPLTLHYALTTSVRYKELEPLYLLLKKVKLP